MKYSIKALSKAGNDAVVHIKQSEIAFGTTEGTADSLPNPAELFLGAFAACVLKNVERFSKMMRFSYEEARLKITAERLENPPRMDYLTYELTIFTKEERLNTDLLKKNIEKFGTIFNTVKRSSSISGSITTITNV